MAANTGLTDDNVARALVVPLAERYRLRIDGPLPVAEGTAVAVGAPLGTCAGVQVHAPVAGLVTSGDTLLTIDTDRAATERTGPVAEAHRLAPLNPATVTAPELLTRMAAAGLVGLGGGAFPSAEKLRSALAAEHGVQALVVNAVACEAGISGDALVAATAAATVMDGVQALAQVTEAPVCIAVGAALQSKRRALEAAIAAMHDATDKAINVQLVDIPDGAAAGAEAVLLRRLYGFHTQRGQRPSAAGYLCYNLTTLFALGQALTAGQPLIQRPVTLPGGNAWVRIGHPFAELPVARPWRSGGHLSGQHAPADSYLTKATLAVHRAPPATAATPCISCARCQPACPVGLDPEWLHRLLNRGLATAREPNELTAAGLDRCIECGYCDPACPSDIPLLAQFRRGKVQQGHQRTAAADAARAEQRFAAHEQRREAAATASANRRADRLRQRTGQARRWGSGGAKEQP